MPLHAGSGGVRPPGKAATAAPSAGPSKPDVKQLRQQAAAAAAAASTQGDDDDDDQETTTDDSSDEEAAFEMDGQELWTQTYCVTCDCLIEPGEGIAKASTTTDTPSSPVVHSTLKSRSGTIKGRSSNASDTLASNPDQSNAAPAAKPTPPAPLKRTHSAGRLQAKAGAAPLGPHKRTGSAGSRLNALSELRPTTKLHDDKPKPKVSGRDASGPHGRKSPAASRPGSAASNRSHSNSSGPSSFKSNEAVAAASTTTNSTDAHARTKKRGFLGGLGLTPAVLKQQQDELSAKRKAPTPLYCSERCRLIDERRSSGLGELAQYLSQPLLPPTNTAWAPPPPPSQSWTRSASVSSIPLANDTPESDCLCPDCIDKYADGNSANGAAIPSGASDTATESSSGFVYGRGVAQKPRTASGRLITPLGLHAPGAGTDDYFPQYAPGYTMTSAAQNSPRVRPAEPLPYHDTLRGSSIPARTSSAASGGRASTTGTEGSGLSSESGSSLWEPRLKPRTNSGAQSATGSHTTMRNGFATGAGAAPGIASGLSTNTATPAITPRQSMIVPSSSGSHSTARTAHRLSVPGFADTHQVDEESLHSSSINRATTPSSTLPHRPASRSKRSSLLLATSPLHLLDRASQHHAAPSIDLFSDHVGSPSTRGSLLSRSLASEHTLMGTSGITLMNQPTTIPSSDNAHPQLHEARVANPGRRPSVLSQSLSSQSMAEPYRRDHSTQLTDSDEGLSMAVGSLKLAQSRVSGPLSSNTRRATDTSETRPTDPRRLSLFGVAGAPARRNSNAVSISSSNSGSATSGWLRSISSAWLNWRSTASPAPMQHDSDVFHSTDDSDEWPSRGSDSASRRESNASRASSSHRASYAQKRASSMRDVHTEQGGMLHPADISQQPAEDRAAVITPTQSLVARPTIRRGHVPAYVSEIGQGGIPGDSLPVDASRGHSATVTAADPAERLARARVDSFTRLADADAAQKKASRRRSRDISVLPPLLAPISRSGSSTNLYAQMPRSARAYSTGRAWTAANTPQMYVGSAGSSHQQYAAAGQPPQSPTLMRSPYQSSHALTQDAARAAMSPSRPNSAAAYHSLPYSAGTSPRAKGLGWGAMTSIASPPTASHMPAAAPAQHGGHRQSISYGHAAAIASRQCANQAQKAQHHHHHHHHHHHGHQHEHQNQHQHHQSSRHGHGHGHRNGSFGSEQHAASGQADGRVAVGHVMNLGAMPHSAGQPAYGRHSTMPVTMHRSPTPSVPEDGGEMTSQDLTSGDFVVRPNSAMAGQTGRRHHRTSLMPPPRSRSSMGMHASRAGVQPLTPSEAVLAPASEDVAAEDGANHAEAPLLQQQPQHEPPRTWSYDHLSGLKTYPILQLPDRETHDVYDPAWGLDAGGLAKHLGQDRSSHPRSQDVGTSDGVADDASGNTVQMGFQPHRKKLFYFDA